MIQRNPLSVTRSSTIQQALEKLDHSGAGLLLLTDTFGRFERTITDGDLRRMLLKGSSIDDTLANLPEKNPVVLGVNYSLKQALALMAQHSFNHLPVVDADGHVLEVLERKKIDHQILLSTPHMGSWEKDYVEEAFSTNWIAPLGPNVDAFEREIADLVGAKHAAALSSGTAAIHLALCMLGVQRGDTVFCSTLTFAASANPIIYQGAEPVFIDSEPTSWNMSPVALEKAFDKASKEGRLPKAVIVVNLYGQSADMDALGAICEHYGVPIVEDAAESLGARYKGRASGTFGAMGIYSFNGNKIITTSGGGMLVSNSLELIERARFLATQARDPAPYYQHSVVGFNYRMSNILAGVGRGQLKVLEERVLARRAVFETYRKELAGLVSIEWMPEPAWSYSTHWLSTCTIRPEAAGISASELIERLSADMIEARPLWKPMHLQPVFNKCSYFTHSEYSVSDLLFEQGICLPSGSNMSEDSIERVIKSLRRWLSA